MILSVPAYIHDVVQIATYTLTKQHSVDCACNRVHVHSLLTTTTQNLESWHHDAIHLPGLLHVLSGGLCYHAMLATTVISSP